MKVKSGLVLPPPAAEAVLSVPDREQAEGNEEQRQEEDVAAAQGKHDQRDGYPDGERAQHVVLLLLGCQLRGGGR